jgi:hypothetical protein
VRSERLTQCALIAEGLVTALTNSAVRLSACLQAEQARPAWQHKTAREGLDHALTLLRSHMGPLIDGEEGTSPSLVS